MTAASSVVFTNSEECCGHRPEQRKHAEEHRSTAVVLAVGLNSGMTLGAAVVILFLKPLLTAVFLRAGAVGGMLTPALATGAAMGSVFALIINTWTELAVSVPAVSLTCAAGVVAITQRAPVWAAIFVWELARPPGWLLAPFLVAAVIAHAIGLLTERQRRATHAD